jgi:alpha/beta superfamily hydrolase
MVRVPPVSKSLIPGNAGLIEVALHMPETVRLRAVGVVAHPHPLFSGTMDNKVVTSLARAFADAGAAAWRFNFRGVGQSVGTHDEGRGETEDMIAVIRHACAANPGLPLWLSGFSFGGAVALAACGQVSASEVILVAPAIQRLAHLRHSPAGGTAPESTLIIHGESDDTVPLADSLDWARPRDIPVMVVPGADHFFHQRLHLVKRIVARWLAWRE